MFVLCPDTWAGRDEKHNNKQEADSLILSNLKRKEVIVILTMISPKPVLRNV